MNLFPLMLTKITLHRTAAIRMETMRAVMFLLHSWTVLRSQCVAEESIVRHAQSDGCKDYHPCITDEWCSDADEWDEDVEDINTCSVNEMPASERQVTVDSLSRSEVVVLPTANDSSSVVQHDKSSDEMKSSDEPELLLMRLSVDDQAPNLDSTHDASNEVHSSSDANDDELLNRPCVSTSNATTQLEPYYVYVIDEPIVTDCSDHVEDLLTRYRLQDGRGFTAELESGNCMYVILQHFLCFC